jgi:hypothetical protein
MIDQGHNVSQLTSGGTQLGASESPYMPPDLTIADSSSDCKGSILCKGCNSFLKDILRYAPQLDDNKTWGDHQFILCTKCPVFDVEGLCVFAQYIGKNRISGSEVKRWLYQLDAMGCQKCGSHPLYAPYNNVKAGELTVNYVRAGCGRSIC